MARDPEMHRMASAMGGYATASKYDGREITSKARAKFMARFLEQVDPDHTLPEQERIKRADAALKAHMTKLSLRAKQARAKKKRTR